MSVLAFDLGAGSGRGILGTLKNERMEIREIHRFSNDPVQVGNHLHWDILRLFYEVGQGMLKAGREADLRSVGFDTWAVDFGLLAKNGELLGNPYHYRDHHTDGVMDEVFRIVPKEEIFRKTGIQFLPFNTIYQLFALKKNRSPFLEQADALLMIPDLLRYFLTGEKRSEFTNATTTQLFNPLTRNWDDDLIRRLGLPGHLFQKAVEPGSEIGVLRDSVRRELGVGRVPVIAVGEHDTASAVAAVPAAEPDFAYLSCGTWSLMGTETKEPVLGPRALELNFTNEGGVDQTFRLLKNIMGLWLLQECRRIWEKEGHSYSYPELVQKAEAARPFRSLVDPDDDVFLNPENMPAEIARFCRNSGQPEPESVGEYVRCVLESLALKYRYVLERTEELSGKTFSGLHMVGGGIQNQLLCQFTANALGRPVWAGPIEGSAIGNLLLQWMASGELGSIREARQVVRRSFEMATYEPENTSEWEEAYGKFCELIR